jgi:two-component system, LytTR family, sensor histidine kinase AlgZ
VVSSYIQRNRILLVHISFWLVYVSFNLFRLSSIKGGEIPWSTRLVFTGTAVFFNLAIAYLNYFLILPRFLENRRFGRYLFELVVPLVVLVILRVIIIRFYVDGYSHQEGYFYSAVYVAQVGADMLVILFFVGMLRFAVDLFELEARRKEIENQNLSSELRFLKAQINPHFLFNTLNNLYYLAYSKSEHTTEVIEKLSQMMRYMIYDTNLPQVPLDKEIEYMRNYISIERLRLNNEIPITFRVEGDTSDIRVAPLVFITFLENAFKHGVSNNNPDSWIKALIRVNGKVIDYHVENSIANRSREQENGESQNGIGLQNLRRRLELSYPERHQLDMNLRDNKFEVHLHLSLA